MHEAPRVIQLLWCPYSNTSVDFTKQLKAEKSLRITTCKFCSVPKYAELEMYFLCISSSWSVADDDKDQTCQAAPSSISMHTQNACFLFSKPVSSVAKILEDIWEDGVFCTPTATKAAAKLGSSSTATKHTCGLHSFQKNRDFGDVAIKHCSPTTLLLQHKKIHLDHIQPGTETDLTPFWSVPLLELGLNHREK